MAESTTASLPRPPRMLEPNCRVARSLRAVRKGMITLTLAGERDSSLTGSLELNVLGLALSGGPGHRDEESVGAGRHRFEAQGSMVPHGGPARGFIKALRDWRDSIEETPESRFVFDDAYSGTEVGSLVEAADIVIDVEITALIRADSIDEQ